ncbi:MAG: hypothetical protein JXX29_08270 [Deltaproteobacteria bacterium]|nr:hypothetical protein [Deltaproteobacteria bacterium]MBN2671655.1 hypothetical protein [Deltaproteobacteria bacterium]
MNIINLASMLLAQQNVKPSPTNVGFELEIWKWVVIIAAGAFVAIFAIKRIGDIVAKKRTESMIENVVGEGESTKNTEWIEDEEE